MAESLPSPQSLNPSPSPAKPDPYNPPSQPNPHPESAPQPLPSAPTPPPPALNHGSYSNPPPAPPVPTPIPLYAPPGVPGPPLFRPAMPQFTPVSGPVNYQNPNVISAPGMPNPAGPPPMMHCQVQVPVPGQPPNPNMRPYLPVPNGYAMPPPGIPGYSTPYSAVARPVFPPRPPVPRPSISLIPGVRPIIPPVVRPGLVPVTPAEKPQTTIYIGKIAPTADNDFMLTLLKLCGPVKSWKRVQDPTDGTLKRFGFCEFESAEGVLRALRLLNKFNIDGQELVLNLNEATKGYLLHYIEKKTENAKKEKENEAASMVEKEGDAVPGAVKIDSAKPCIEDLKKDDSNAGKKDDSESGKKDEADLGKKDPDYAEFGLVTDEDREADKEALEKMTGMIEERLKSLPPPPPHAPADASGGITDSEATTRSRDRDSDADLVKNDGEDRNDDETTSDNKALSEHDKTEASSPDRSRRYDRRSRDRDRDRDLKKEKEREIERYERDAERERIRKEREQRRKVEDAEREYEERLKDWEYREREREKQRQYEREREKERERKRKKEIIYDEEYGEEDSRRWRHRSALEENRKKRQREKDDDLADRIKEEEEIAEAKKRAEEEEKQRLVQREEDMEQVADHAANGTEDSGMIEEPTTERMDEDDFGGGNHLGEEASQFFSGNASVPTIVTASDMQSNGNAPAKKLGFGLSGSGKRTAVPSVFHEDDDDDAQKEKKMRPLVPIDYSNEEMEAVQAADGASQPNLAAAAEFAKRLSNNSRKEEKPESERERSRRSHDRLSQREKDRHDDENKEKGLHREHGSEKSRTTPDNKKLLDAKQLIDMIPKTKEDLFSYEINWTLYDQHKLHERMRPWISKKITEFLGEEEKSLVDYIVSSTQEHVKATEMLETLKSILDEEAEMFVLKMWRMLIYEVKRVETGLHLRSKA